ncbi:MAG: FecR family protein [Beijerinckiaceae bacterium]|nr:FecR family protein [Beijerinckiaceae bacterium]
MKKLATSQAFHSRDLNARCLLQLRTTLCLIAIALPQAVPAADTIGEVTLARGRAFLSRESGNELAEKGVAVLLDDTALTGDDSRLGLQLGSSTSIRLGANASLKIDRFIAGRDTTVTLDTGPLVVERWKGATPKLEVKTPYALLAARGTEFFAGPSKGLFGVFVKRGIVEVKTLRGTVRLKAGEGTDFNAPGDPPSLPKVWAPARVDAALWSVR